MRNMKKINTQIIDAGGRFGLHPTWKDFTGEMRYYLFEPDKLEAERLMTKYAKRKDEIVIDKRALSNQPKKICLNMLENRAMSTAYKRPKEKEYFTENLSSQVNIVEKINVKATTIDKYCRENDISVDFLKLDVEGGEYDILNGAKEQLNNIIGIRSEVNFDQTFEDSVLFSQINDFLLDKNFFLLNLDYDGRGSRLNDFVDARGRYGILKDCDAVWMKGQDEIFSLDNVDVDMLSINILKYSAFCFMNNAPDLGIEILLKAIKNEGVNFDNLNKTKLYEFLDIQIHRLFYNLKWSPGQNLSEHENIYKIIFNKEMKVLHHFNESLKLNPR